MVLLGLLLIFQDGLRLILEGGKRNPVSATTPAIHRLMLGSLDTTTLHIHSRSALFWFVKRPPLPLLSFDSILMLDGGVHHPVDPTGVDSHQTN